LQIYQWVNQWKNFENRLTFGEVMGKSLVSCFFLRHSVLWLQEEACSSGLLQHGLNFSTAWCTMRLISAEKNWKHVLMQNVFTLNTCCDIACLTFQLSHITTGSFQSHRRHCWWWKRENATSEPPEFERTQQTFSQMKKFCSSQVSVVTFSAGVSKWITVCFLLR